MATLYNIRERAELLSQKVETGSITPEEVGALIIDFVDYTQGLEREGATLGIRKVYPTLEAMQADRQPYGDNGKALRRGNLVAIYQEESAATDPNSGLVSMWTGSSWVSVARIGTAMRHEYTSIESRITEAEKVIEQELKPEDSTLRTLLESLKNDIESALDRLEYTDQDKARLNLIKDDGEKRDYLGADGQYHRLPIQGVVLNGHLLSTDERGQINITTPKGTVTSFVLNGTKLTPIGDGTLELGLSLKSELLENKRIKVSLLSADNIELSSVELPQGGSGSGAGFLNITRQVPLSSGYYSLSGALSALRSLQLGEEVRKGTIITIETAEGKWTDYRYIGNRTDDTSFYSLPLWKEYAIEVTDDHIRSVAQAIMPDMELAHSLDESNRPIASNVVKHAIDELHDIQFDSDVDPQEDGSRVTLSHNGRTVTEFVVPGGGGGTQSSSTTKAIVTASLSDKRIKLGDRVSLTYGYTHYSDGAVDGIPASITVSLKRGIQTIATLPLGILASGVTASLDLTKYITSADSYSLFVSAQYEEEGQVKERRAHALLSVVNLSIDLYNRSEIETYLSSGGYKDGDTANIILSVRGGAREITMLIDGEESSREMRPLAGSGSRQTFQIPIRSLSAGRHSIQFVASVDGLLSNSLYIDILKYGNDTPFLGLIFSRADGRLFSSGQTPEVLAYQYEEAQWDYIALGRGAGGVTQLSLTTPNGNNVFTTPRTYQTMRTRFTQQGTVEQQYSLEGATRTLKIRVEPTSLSGVGIKEGAVVELLASGRSNVESKPNVWTSGRTTTSFRGVDFASSGWTGESLRLINGASALIDYRPFATDAKMRGLTLSFECRMTNVRSALDAIISCMDIEAQAEGGFAGFAISSSKVQMPTGGKLEFRTEDGEMITRYLGLEMPYASGEYYSLTLVIHPTSEQKSIRLYINGVLSKADIYQDTTFVQRSPKGILIDSTAADLELRHVRIYETALTDDEVLVNYITDRPTLVEMDNLRERNDVLNEETGQISYDKLVSRGRAVLSIAMEGGGLERLWGKSTDTKTNFTFDELIFRSPYGKAYDLRITKGVIRRQGTSTSTYPVKNLRIYLQRVATTKVYRNVGQEQDDVWEEVPERTYVMRQGSKPMKIINLKTDYADSSLAYNTGTAILLNDHLVAKNPNLRNAGQKADPQARMAIDGMPIDVFTSDTPLGAKTYCGQFQFNNDKSKSGYLFGQNKKDGSEIALEFINNTNPVANFHITADVREQLGRQGTDGFDASVEFLFPEKDYLWNSNKPEEVAPEPIKQAVIRLWQFIKDCTPSGVDPSTMTEDQVKVAFKSEKFRQEVAQYFDVTNLTMWWVLTDYHMSVDQRVKNTFFRTWGDGIWWLTYYDGDTAFGKRNDAFLAYDYNINRDTFDTQRNKYAFEGHNSRLWCLVLANLDAELKASAKILRTTLTNDVYLSVFNQEIMNNWSERQYNKSGIYKYLKPVYFDYNGGGTMNYAFALNGNMYALRNQLIERRFSMLDAKYLVGQYESDAVTGYIGKDDRDTTIKAIASDEYYFAWKTQNGNLTEHQGVGIGEVATFNFRDAMSQNDPVRLIGASRMRTIDFSTTSSYLQGAWNFNSCKHLEELLAPTTAATPTQWYPLLNRISGLKRIDLTGQKGVTGTEDEQARTFDVSAHSGIQELLLNGTSIKAVRVASGSPITRMELPQTLSYLRLRALPYLTMSGLQVADWRQITSLEIAGCPQLNWKRILEQCTALERLRIEGVDIEDDGSLLRKLISVKGLDAHGSAVDTCELVGKCQLSVYIDEEEITRLRAHFPSLYIRQPDYTMIEFDDTVADPKNISNLDNKTGYKFGNEYQPSAHILAILNARFGCLGKQEELGTMKICRLHEGDFRFYADHKNTSLATPAKLDFSEGDLFIYEPLYWYKGINDVKNMKKYALYAYGEKPTSPSGKKILMADIALGVDGCIKVSGFAITPSDNLERSMKQAGGYSVCNIPVSGYRRVRFPSVSEGNFFGGVFLDNANQVLAAHSVTSRNKTVFLDGMYWYEDIPEGAVRFAFTILDNSGQSEDFVWLTNSERIEDIEPEWVEHRPTLVAGLKASVWGGKLTSSSSVLGESEFVSGRTLEEFEDLAAVRGLKVMTWSMRKDIVNLFMAKYGTRDSNSIYGLPSNEYYNERNRARLGWCADTGMNDTTAQGGRKKILTAGGVSYQQSYGYALAKEMGYENFEWASREFVSGLSFINRAGTVQYIGVTDGETQRGVAIVQTGHPAYGWGSYIARVLHGKYMDILPISTLDPERNNGFYRDQTRLDVSSACVYTFGHDHDQAGGLGLFTLRAYPLATKDAQTTVRLAFQGHIQEIKDIQEYQNITNNH